MPRRRRPTIVGMRPTVVVAIPARDEAERIAACLEALDRQTILPDAVVLLANNCTDDTVAVARRLSLQYPLDAVAVDLSPQQAGAGHARRLAMQHAAERAGEDGILLTTDADSTAPPDWIERNIAALTAGVDLVCGQSVLEAVEARLIPHHLHDDDVLECRLAALIDQMAGIIDPDPADPLPRHQENAGASLGVWVSAWRKVGGIPPLVTGEDRGFVAALRRMDASIRHDPTIFVTVSGRVVGRAAGGMADTIRRRMMQQDEFTDETLEPPTDALRRLTLRASARSVWQQPRPDTVLAAQLAIDPVWLEQVLLRPFFGAAWEQIEAHSLLATRRRVRFADLPHHIAVAELLLASLEGRDRLAAD